MNRRQARRAFDTYVSAYDPTNPRIALKVEHTLRVADLCERIARALGMGERDVDLAWLLGLLHDIGRFEQVRRYDTFSNAASVSHAALGVEVLFGEDDCGEILLRRFCPDEGTDGLICTAVGTHSAYRLPDTLDERTRTLCNALRDADKIDILAVNCLCPITDIYGVTERDMVESPVSPACVDIFYQHRCLPRGVRQYPADIMLGHICFAWELCFEESLRIMREQGFLARMLSRTWALPQTQQAFDAMAAHMRAELGV